MQCGALPDWAHVAFLHAHLLFTSNPIFYLNPPPSGVAVAPASVFFLMKRMKESDQEASMEMAPTSEYRAD